MKFIVATIDGARVLCQFADMAPVQWIDARVAEAIGYSYAVRFETRAGADRCAFIHNGAAVALGDWDHDRETLGTSSGRCTCGLRASQRLGGGERRPRGLGGSADRSGPARGVQAERPRLVTGSVPVRGFQKGAGMPPVASAPVREYRRNIIAAGWSEYESVNSITQGHG